MQAVIESSNLKEEFRPLLVRFTNGKLTPNQDSIMKYRLYNTVPGNKDHSKRKILVSETDRLSYVGKNYNPEQQPPFKYLLGIFDKKTKKMRVCDADMFHMLPFVKSDSVIPAKPQRESSQINRDELTAAFGSSNKRKAMEARVKNKVDTDTFTKLADVAVGDTKESSSDMKIAATGLSHLADILPPMDRDSDTVTGVFLVDQMLAEFEWKALENIARNVIKDIDGYIADWQGRLFPKLSINYLMHSKKLGESSQIYRIQLLLFVNYLATVLHFSSRDKEKRDPFPKDIPLVIRKRLLKDFTGIGTEKQRVLISSRMKDKILLHLLSLALIICDFEVETADLQKDFRIEPAKIKSLYNLLGVSVVKSKGSTHDIARLTLPLMPLPEKFRSKRKIRL